MRTAGKPAWALALALLVTAGGALLLVAQQPPPPSEQKQGPIQPRPPEQEAPYTLQVEVPLVNVDVAVVDRDGNFIHNLRKEHFRVYEDGVEQEIVAFAPSETSLTAVLLVEATPAVGYILWENLDAAYLFLNQLRKDDWAALVGYDIKPRIEVDFTHDRREIVNALRHMQYGGGRFSEANMYDAIIDTLERLKDVEGKKSIILIGTGFDTFSKHIWDETRKVVREHRTSIFTVNTSWLLELYYDRLEARGYRVGAARLDIHLALAQMHDLAAQTGGRSYAPRFITEMPGIYNEIGAMLRNQYSLAFRPKNFKRDGKFHEIKVKLMAPDGQPLQVINQDGKKVKYEIYARKGYYAPKA